MERELNKNNDDDTKSNFTSDRESPSKMSFKLEANKRKSGIVPNLKPISEPKPSVNSIDTNLKKSKEGIVKSLLAFESKPESSGANAVTPSSLGGPTSNVKDKKSVLFESKLFSKTVANAVNERKSKKKRKIIKHCDDDAALELEEDESISEKEEFAYKFNSDNEFYLAFHSKFFQGFKASNIISFTLTHKKALSKEEIKQISLAYIDKLDAEELCELSKQMQTKIQEQEEISIVNL